MLIVGLGRGSVCGVVVWSAPIAVDTMVDMVKICWWYLVYAYIS